MVRCRRQPTGPAALWRLGPDRSDEACFATLPSALLATFHRAYLHDKVFSRIPPGAPQNLFSTHQTAREKETHYQHPQRQDRPRGPRRRLPGPARRRRCVVSPVRRCCPRPWQFLTQRRARRRDAPPRRRASPAPATLWPAQGRWPTRPPRPPVTCPPGGRSPLRRNAARAQQLADRAGNTAGESQDCRYRRRPRRSLHSRSKQSGARLAALTRQFDKALATLTGS